jgi:hypothetical protein
LLLKKEEARWEVKPQLQVARHDQNNPKDALG